MRTRVSDIPRTFTTLLFGDKKCLAPRYTHPVIKDANTLLDHIMEHILNTRACIESVELRIERPLAVASSRCSGAFP